MRKLRIGVSACLLGQEVRWNGGHKKDRFLVEDLARVADFVPVCPEVELGMGVPREPVRLVRLGEKTHMVAVDSGQDWTARMEAFARRRVAALGADDLDGYVLKKDSPSCGMERVKLYGPEGAPVPRRDGTGLFAAALRERLPLLPLEEEGRLQDEGLRTNFVARVHAFRRLKDLFAPRWKVGALVAFHAAEKLALLAHDPGAYAALGRLVARAASLPREELVSAYGEAFMRALARVPTRARHVNVLQHMAGYFKRSLDDEDRRELQASIEAFRSGAEPLAAPLTLLRHHVRKQGVEYLAGQTYLREAGRNT